MKRVSSWLLALTLVAGWASPGWAAGVKLTIHAGRVSLDAQDVTIRQILTEWARIGKTRIVNLERVNSGPVTMKFDELSEEEALDTILRSLPGYMAAPRATLVADASIYDRILIMPTTTAVAALPAQRGQAQIFQDTGPNITQLRPTTPPLYPGLLPEPEDPRDSNDPAIAAAAAAGLMAPTPMPGVPAQGPLLPPARNFNPALPIPTQQAPTTPTPSNPWNVPTGPSQPGLAPTPPPPSTNPPPNRPVGGARPQDADR
jgi:hypothetical protein